MIIDRIDPNTTTSPAMRERLGGAAVAIALRMRRDARVRVLRSKLAPMKSLITAASSAKHPLAFLRARLFPHLRRLTDPRVYFVAVVSAALDVTAATVIRMRSRRRR